MHSMHGTRLTAALHDVAESEAAAARMHAADEAGAGRGELAQNGSGRENGGSMQ